MRDHDDRVTRLLVECIDEIHDPVRIALVEIARRLIGEEIWHIRNKGSSNRHSLLLTTRELSGISASLACESYLLEDHTGLIATRSMGDIEDEIDVLRDRQVGYQLERLEYERDMSPTILDHLIGREGRDISHSEIYIPTIGTDDPSDEGEEGGLASTTRSHE